ncbi:hypothetical protein AU380_18845 [Pseudomonas aeruginosa]|nr:hypothetical protein AU380_18845 [Pseudomonas aeruginosa]
MGGGLNDSGRRLGEREELIDNRAAVLFVVFKGAIAQPLLRGTIERALVEAGRLAGLIQLLGGQQVLLHAHAATQCDVHVENGRSMALPGGFAA